MSLIHTVRAQLAASKGEWPDICRVTGVSYWWLTKFAQGRIKNPGVKHLEVLHKHFSSAPVAAEPETGHA